jgi:phenylpyruvate tautomerase PptA (4-oxalocrotonate tautomerase family)
MPIIQFDIAQEVWTSEQEMSLIRNITKAVQQVKNVALDKHLVVFIRESPAASQAPTLKRTVTAAARRKILSRPSARSDRPSASV